MAKYSVGQSHLVALWNGKDYDIDIVRVWPYDSSRKTYKYEVRWVGVKNTAGKGKLPNNESTYDERWIKGKTLDGTPQKPARAPVKAPRHASNIVQAAKNSTGLRRKSSLAAARSTSNTSCVVSKYQDKWQYYDNGRKPGPWHDYDSQASDIVEEVYAEWVKNPHIDVRAVKSGEFNYMVDFNLMEQQNIDYSTHTKRKIRRVLKSSGQPSMGDAERIRQQRAAAAPAA